MEDEVDTGSDVCYRVDITDIHLVEREVPGVMESLEVLLAPRHKVVDAANVVAAVKQGVGEMRPDEPPDTGNECSRYASEFSGVGMVLSTSSAIPG